jgi:hypothetical protein
MSFVWTLPGQLPDKAALDRMRQHFQEPAEPMPEAWFMSGEINYWTGLVGVDPTEFEASTLGHTIDEAVSGIRCFPEIRFVPVWKAWIPYLLPYALAHETEYHTRTTLSSSVISALLNIYPNGIIEEYQGFRNDIIHAICARALPHTLARDNPKPDQENILIITDIWDGNSFFFTDEPDEIIGFPILFCLKYLRTSEIEEWAASMLGIESVQIRLRFMIWWLAFNRFLTGAQEWPQDGKVRDLLEEAGLPSPFFLPAFPSFDAFIPSANLAAFKSYLAKQLTFDLFQQWSADIKANADYYLSVVEPVLQRFEREFFGQLDNK